MHSSLPTSAAVSDSNDTLVVGHGHESRASRDGQPRTAEVERVSAHDPAAGIDRIMDRRSTRDGTETPTIAALDEQKDERGEHDTVRGDKEDLRAGGVGIGEILDEDGKLRPTSSRPHDYETTMGAPTPPTGIKLFFLLIGLLLIEVLSGLDNTIVATSTATIANDFGALQDVGWYGSAFLLATVSLQPLFGRAFAFFPQKWVLILALVIFMLGCVVAAVAQSSPVLIFGRAIQGAGYAGLFIGILQICANALSVRTQAMVTSLMNVS